MIFGPYYDITECISLFNILFGKGMAMREHYTIFRQRGTTNNGRVVSNLLVPNVQNVVHFIDTRKKLKLEEPM